MNFQKGDIVEILPEWVVQGCSCKGKQLCCETFPDEYMICRIAREPDFDHLVIEPLFEESFPLKGSLSKKLQQLPESYLRKLTPLEVLARATKDPVD